MTPAIESPMRFGSEQQSFDAALEWEFLRESTLECRVLLVPEEEGGYSAHCLRLPGGISEGETIDEALTNIADAFRESIRYYRDSGTGIPWQERELDRPKGSVVRWILVNV